MFSLFKGTRVFRNAAPAPVFVVSSPRSGSTWLKQALNSHSAIHCTENRLFGPHYDVVLDGPEKQPRLRITLDAYVNALKKSIAVDQINLNDNDLSFRLSRDLAHALIKTEHEISGGKLIVDKFTPYVGTAELAVQNLRAVFPKAKFVHLVRDGRDVATSGVFHWLNKSLEGTTTDPLVEKRNRFFKDEEGKMAPPKRFFTESELTEWAQTWAEPVNVMLALSKKTSVLTICYEDMLGDMRRELSRFFRFVGVNCSSDSIERCVADSSFEKMSGGRKQGDEQPTAHVRKGVSGDWKNYFTQQDAEQFAKLTGSLLNELGYEPDSKWPSNCPTQLNIANAA